MRHSELPPTPERSHADDRSDADILASVVDMTRLGADMHGVLSRVTAETAESAVAQGVARIKGSRERWLDDAEHGAPSVVFKGYSDRASKESHAIQCSVNKEVDLGKLRDAARDAYADLPPEKAGDKEFIGEVLDRQIRMNRLMSQVFVADILRRIGQLKGDSRITDAGMVRLDVSREALLASLDEFEKANGDKIAETPGIDDVLISLRASLRNAPGERLRETLYTEIAVPYSMVIGYDIEDFNDQELREAFERLDE